MPTNTYKCPECGFKEEYIESFSIPKHYWHPEYCPKCNKAKLEKVFDMTSMHGGFDIIGSCYMNDYGKKAWKKRLSLSDQAKVLSGELNPY